MTKLTDWLAGERKRESLIAFVHVPKTAGSTVNRVLRGSSYRGREQCQSIARDEFDYVARHCDWISGHLPRDQFESRLNCLDRPVEYFATIREPVSQLVSHLNWQFELFRLGWQVAYDEHAYEVRATDFSDVEAIKSLLLRWGFVFLNCQSSFVVGSDFVDLTQNEFARRIASYAQIATEINLAKLYSAFGFRKLLEDSDTLRENSTRRYFDDRMFQRPEIKEFLAEHHAHDLRLYDAVQKMSWPLEGRDPFRSARFGCRIVTPDNFEEKAYLEANPDVAEEVRRGTFSSGRQHYDIYGHAERRLMPRHGVKTRIRRVHRKSKHFLSERLESMRRGWLAMMPYNEEAYLDANPDVSEAVRSKMFVSGRQHYDLYGRAEGRSKRRFVSKANFDTLGQSFQSASASQSNETGIGEDLPVTPSRGGGQDG